MKSKKQRRLLSDILVNGGLALIVIAWLIPVVALVASSFRTRFDIQTSGWWTILPHRAWQMGGNGSSAEGVDRNGVMQIEGAQGTFEQFRDGIQVGNTKVIWIGNRRTGNIEIQKESWTTNVAFTLDNYKQVIGGRSVDVRKPDGTIETVPVCNMLAPFLNSLIVAIPSTVIPILIAAFAAYGFAWMKFPGRRLLFILIVALLVVPLQIAFVPILKDYAKLQLNGTFLGVWLAHTGFGLPLACLPAV